MVEVFQSQKDKLALIEKVNSVFLGTRDFKELGEQSVKLMTNELEDVGVLGTAIFRVHEAENLLYAYAYAARHFGAVERLLPKKFSELNVSLDDPYSLLVRAVVRKEIQQSTNLYDLARPTFNQTLSLSVQKAVGFSLMVAYPLRLKKGKVGGVIAFALENQELTEEQGILLETFRSQLELALENVLEFEQVIERYKKSIARSSPATHEETIPTIRFTLRITPKQNALLEQKARGLETDKASLIRSWIDEKAEK